MTAWPEAWGTIRAVEAALGDDAEGEWAGDWRQWAFPGENSRYGHNTPCSVCPDTGVLQVEGEVVALLDVVHLVIENLYVYDAEYYQARRVRELVDARRWSRLPAAAFGVGDVVYAWDKYRLLDYPRADADANFSFGGEWPDLQALVDEKLGPAPGARADAHESGTLFALMRAVEAGDAARVRALLAAGVDPTAGAETPRDRNIELLRTVHKNTTPLWASINCADPDVLRAMLERGADPSWQPPGAMALVHGAVATGRVEHLRLLLAAGADTRATWRGQTCRELAVAARRSDIVRLLDGS